MMALRRRTANEVQELLLQLHQTRCRWQQEGGWALKQQLDTLFQDACDEGLENEEPSQSIETTDNDTDGLATRQPHFFHPQVKPTSIVMDRAQVGVLRGDQHSIALEGWNNTIHNRRNYVLLYLPTKVHVMEWQPSSQKFPVPRVDKQWLYQDAFYTSVQHFLRGLQPALDWSSVSIILTPGYSSRCRVQWQVSQPTKLAVLDAATAVSYVNCLAAKGETVMFFWLRSE